MCRSPRAYSPPPAPKLPEAPVAPTSEGSKFKDKDRQRRAGFGGIGNTILTSSSGVKGSSSSGPKTLLGM